MTTASKRATVKNAAASEAPVLAAVRGLAGQYLADTFAAGVQERKLIDLLKTWAAPTYDEWEAVRKAFQDQRPPEMTEAASRMAWSRLVKAAGLEKPKATSADAASKQNAREKVKSELVVLSDTALKTRVDALLKAGFGPSDPAVKRLSGEIKRREDAALEPVKAQMADDRKAIKTALKECKDVAILKKIRTLLKV